MKRKEAILRLSPNEEARIIREEYERRRKLRIQQVREQQRCIALNIRTAVEQRRQHELQQLGKELRGEWEHEQREKINSLQKLYHESLQLLGQGQRSAKENEPDWAAIAQREGENHAKAEERFLEALKELKSQRLQDYKRQSRSINARKKALEAEKERSARMASLPLPPPNPIQNIDFKKPHRIRKSDMSAFATTYYHMADRIAERQADQIQPNAHEEAEVELKRLQKSDMDKMRRREEQLKNAHLRGKQAMRREHFEQDRERLLVELEHMRLRDLLKRRQQVAKMPPLVFQPLYQRTEIKEDFQRQMEFAFEDVYTGERKVKVDLEVPKALPELSTGSQDIELDITLDEVAPQLSENTQPDSEQGTERTEQELLTEVEQIEPAPKHPLKKLLDRIRSQRNQWIEHETAPDLPTVITDEIPEKDTTTDTALKTSQQSTAADTHLPDECIKRQEERKKRVEELERQKLEQFSLLQDLEEQKAKLEQMLKSQQERKWLNMVVTHEKHQPESIISDHEVSSAETTEFMVPTDEDDHTKQIREDQLLERNRIHQTSLEVARLRLEEYQRALQMHYNMAAKVLPAHQPSPLCSGSSQVAAGLSHLTNSAMQASSQDKAQTPKVISTREAPRTSRTRSVPAVESFSSNTQYLTTDISPSLTEAIVERVTGRLRDRARPESVTEPPKQLPSAIIPNTFQTICPSISDVPIQVPGQTGASPQVSVHPLSFGPTEDPVLGRREEQQVHHQQRKKTHTWEMELMRQEKQYLQALIRSDAQSALITEATPEEHMSGNVGQIRRSLLESLLKAIEQRNGGNLSCLRDVQSDKGQAPVRSGKLPHCSMLDKPLSLEGEMEGQMLEPLDQREPGELYPKERELGWEMDMEFMRQQNARLQAMIHTDVRPVPEPAIEELVSDDISQIRHKVFKSLLKAIAETNYGTLSVSDSPQKEDKTASDSGTVTTNVFAGPSPSSFHPRLLFPPWATRPPVTRVKSGVWEMSQQHELSAIPEVETPVNTSLARALDNSLRLSSHGVDRDPLEESNWTPRTSCVETSTSSETSSESSNHLMWTERLLKLSPQCLVVDPNIISLFSDSGRGVDYSGPAVTNLRAPTEAALGATCHESDSLSSTTISTGSYVTTDPEHNSDNSPTLIHVGQGTELLAVFSPPSESMCNKGNSAAESPHLAVERLFHDSRIQCIIDKYTKELNFSLHSPGNSTADSGGLDMQALGVSASEQSLLLDLEKAQRTKSSAVCESVPSVNVAARGKSLQWENAASPVQEQDTFRPLFGQPEDQSSCLAADQRDSAMEHLLGQPSAHSSLIGQLPVLPFSVSLDHSGWDSTPTHMISQIAHQPSTRGQDCSDLQPVGQLSLGHLTNDGSPEESQMKPLLEELDESAGHQIESSGERTLVELEGLAEVTGTPYSKFPLASALDLTLHPQAQTIPADLCSERTEGWDSFHPLMAVITHNETADPFMNLHQPEHNCLDEQPFSWDPGDPTSSTNNDSSETDQSLEFFRAKDPVTSVMTPVSRESFSLLITSQDHICESVLVSPSVKVNVDLMATGLSKLCSDTPVVNIAQPEELVSSGSVEKLTCEEGPCMWDTVSVSEKLDGLLQSQDLANEKGILEQSQITLVSLTDTSLQDQEATLADEAGPWGDKHLDAEMESISLAQSQTLPVTLLKFNWGPGRGLQDICQQKQKVLHQRSSQIFEKNKRAQSWSDTRKQRKGWEPQANCKAKVKITPKVGQEQCSQIAVNSRLPLHKTIRPEAPEVDTKICREQRKFEVSEMHQRTRRLYEQLEEVKQQKSVKSRQEASSQNRLKAKEFHKKTLQKLRAKQTPH